MQYEEASDTGKHCKSREIHNSHGCELRETATTQFFSWERFSDPTSGHCVQWLPLKNEGSFFLAFTVRGKVEISTLCGGKMILCQLLPGLITFDDMTFLKKASVIY